jgi:uncharacterized membrane protein YcaP (DUF421 family)
MALWPQDWSKVLLPQVPILESMVRISIVYLVLFFLLRVVLKRESSGTGISDLLVLVLLADSVQNGMSGQAISVIDALILGGTLIVWDWLLNYIAYHQPWFYRLIHPAPLLIINDGRLIAANARKELLTRDDIEEQMRLQGIESFEQVAKAFVQSNGEISIIPKENETNSNKREERRQV